jgi:dihydrofolate synthase/folylpolyglutamate synthase
MWDEHEDLLAEMDLKGEYQRKNLRTVMAALDVYRGIAPHDLPEWACIRKAIADTAARTGFGGRWQKISDDPMTICDIGHNEHGLRYNFAQLERMKAEGECTELIVVYGSVADKDVDSVIHLMPEDAVYVFTQAQGKRALAAESIRDRYDAFCKENGRSPKGIYSSGTVVDAVSLAYRLAETVKEAGGRPLVYVGGSTYVVSEAVAMLKV